MALIAPKNDRDLANAQAEPQAQPANFLILFHPAYRYGVPAVDFPAISAFTPNTNQVHAAELDDSRVDLPASDNYVDPVGSVDKDYQGRQIAGFALVGNTGFTVVVQQSYEEALELDSATLRNLIVGSAVHWNRHFGAISLGASLTGSL